MTQLSQSRPLEEATVKNSGLRKIRGFAVRKYGHIVVAAFCVLLLATPMPALWSFVLAALLAGVIAATPAKLNRHLCSLDFAVLAFYASSVISTAFAYDVTTALPELNRRTFSLLLYLACRWIEESGTMLMMALATGMTVHCIESLVTFVQSYVQWSKLHFVALADFRSSVTLTAAGVRPGNHAAIYIVAIAVSTYKLCSDQRNRRVETYVFLSSLLLSLVCVVLSLSRGLYLCTVVCLAISAWPVRGKIRLSEKTTLATTSGGIALLAVAFFFARPILLAVGDTALFVVRSSQDRSIAGRLSIDNADLHLAFKSGWIGAGLGNYALAVRHHGLLTPSLLTAHAFNVALEVGIEQGLLGIISLVLILAGVIRVLQHNHPMKRRGTLVGGAAALFLFGMSQSFLFADQATMATLAIFGSLIALGEAGLA